MARVIAPPVFCIMKGAFAASKTPAFLAFTPIIPWPSMSAHHDRVADQQQVKQQSLVRTSDTSNTEGKRLHESAQKSPIRCCIISVVTPCAQDPALRFAFHRCKTTRCAYQREVVQTDRAVGAASQLLVAHHVVLPHDVLVAAGDWEL